MAVKSNEHAHAYLAAFTAYLEAGLEGRDHKLVKELKDAARDELLAHANVKPSRWAE